MALTLNDWAHTWLRIREWARLWFTLRRFATDPTAANERYQSLEDIVTSDRAKFDIDVEQGEEFGTLVLRAGVSAMLGNPRAILDPLMLQLSRAMGFPQTDPIAVLPILFLYMSRNLGSFKSVPMVSQRGFTRGAWTSGTPYQGNGTCLRLNVDAFGNPIESDQPDVLRFECVLDQNGGANPGQEQFRVTGRPFKDGISRYTTGYSIGVGNNVSASNLVGVACDEVQPLVFNPSFSQFSGTGASSSFALTGWTLESGSAASMSVDTTNYYRKSNIEGSTPGALKCTATVTLKQTIPAGQLQAALAYMAQVAVNFSIGSGSGSVRMTVGDATSPAIDFTQASGSAGWLLSRPTINKNLYYQNFVPTGQVTVKLVITVSAGYVLVDDLLLAPWRNIAGKLLWLVGGSTPFTLGDVATITDTVPTTNGAPTTGYVQTMLAEAYGKCLPAYAPATAPSAPTAAATSGGTGASGQYGVVVTFYNGSTLLESKASAETSVILSGSNDRIALTSVPTGPAGTTARYIYITQPNDWNGLTGRFQTPDGPQSAYYFGAQIADNSTTTVTFDPLTGIDLTKPIAVLQDI